MMTDPGADQATASRREQNGRDDGSEVVPCNEAGSTEVSRALEEGLHPYSSSECLLPFHDGFVCISCVVFTWISVFQSYFILCISISYCFD